MRSNMYEQISTLALLSALTLSNLNCVAGDASVNSAAQVGGGRKQAAARRLNFIPVAGADLKSKLDAAVRKGRAAAKATPFWAAYSFEARPGIAIDIDDAEF